MSKKSKKINYFPNSPPDYPVPSVYGEKRNFRPDPTNIYLGTKPGIVVGSEIGSFPKKLVGIPQGKEGNLLVIGANGSGKSRCIAETTLSTWNGAVVTLDIKGELYNYYLKQYKSEKVKRKPILFDPTRIDGMAYDPFRDIVRDSDDEISLLWDTVMAIYPNNVSESDPFWRDTERNILMASFIYYRELNLNFIQIIIKVVSSTVTDLCKDINSGDNDIAKRYIGDTHSLEPKNLAAFSCGLRNTLSNLASNPYFAKAFCSDEKSSGCFGWNDLDNCNIFIRIPEDKIEQWSIPVRIILTQLFRHLMRRPDKYSPQGANNIQTLLLLDEFARFGKIELITEAIATLRSRSVNMCFMLQSLAQLDKIYGTDNRRIICDNCQYKAIINAFDVDTQKYFSELIGSTEKMNEDYTDTEDICGDIVSTSRNYSRHRVPVIYPHEFATLNNILFHTPYGLYHVKKITPDELKMLRVNQETTVKKEDEVIRVQATAILKKRDDSVTNAK